MNTELKNKPEPEAPAMTAEESNEHERIMMERAWGKLDE